MKPAVVLLGVILLVSNTLESCVGRCGSFEPQRKCQCDSMCVYYGSCCADFDTICPKKIARGDTFEEAEDVTDIVTTTAEAATTAPPRSNIMEVTTAAPPLFNTTTPGPVPTGNPDAVVCSGHPFDAFLQLKNGSIYAFRGEYFFELDEKSVLPGYPKLIQDVWGIPGPIDAAFTRINCQGKSYIFKGNQYWRFEGDVLDEDYPRDISVGFDGIPDGVNAAFAIPAPSHRSKEKAYFFKDDSYYQYEFKHQPSHEECVEMTRSSPSVLFTRYTDLYCDQSWEDLFTQLFGGSGKTQGPRLISRNWVGISPPVDATMVGRVHLTPKPSPSPPPVMKRSSRKRKPSKKRGRHSRHSLLDDLWSMDDLFDFSDYIDYRDFTSLSTQHQYQPTPVQNVYFFKKDKYYRVNLQTKRVDLTIPPYPRSIAKYWLGCENEDKPDFIHLSSEPL
uniref:Vitronectin-like n=1 Tax=Sphaeramia orbicularis TaxID=375764 RepID=A0A673BTZ6_9TELE